MAPQVSVIIPNYNHAPFLVQRIESVLNQTFQDFEVLILDDCSFDNSREIIENYRNHPKVVHIEYNIKNSGSTFKQWNKGINLAKGEYIWIAESDDWADERFLEVLTKYNSDLVFCKLIDIDSNGVLLDSAESWLKVFKKIDWNKSHFFEGIDFFEILKERCVIANASSLIFKRTYFNTYYPKIQGMKYCGDWMYYLNLAIDGANFQYVAECTSYFRQHTNTTRWKNKEILKPLIERIECLNFIENKTKNHKIFTNDLINYVCNLRINQIYSIFTNEPSIFIRRPYLLFSAVLYKLKNKLKN